MSPTCSSRPPRRWTRCPASVPRPSTRRWRRRERRPTRCITTRASVSTPTDPTTGPRGCWPPSPPCAPRTWPSAACADRCSSSSTRPRRWSATRNAPGAGSGCSSPEAPRRTRRCRRSGSCGRSWPTAGWPSWARSWTGPPRPSSLPRTRPVTCGGTTSTTRRRSTLCCPPPSPRPPTTRPRRPAASFRRSCGSRSLPSRSTPPSSPRPRAATRCSGRSTRSISNARSSGTRWASARRCRPWRRWPTSPPGTSAGSWSSARPAYRSTG